MLAGVGVTFGDKPGRRVRYAEVQYFARGDEVVEGLHYFGDARMHIPKMNIELRGEDHDQRYSTE